MENFNIDEYLTGYGSKAKKAAFFMGMADTNKKNSALKSIADALIASSGKILKANKIDLENAKANGMSEAMQDRLKLTEERIAGMAEGLVQLTALQDPIGEVIDGFKRPNGLQIVKRRVPLGVLGIIFESRPNVTADAAGLCIKSGNACILRGGKEAINSNIAIAEIFSETLEKSGLPKDAVQLIDNTSREVSTAMMKLNDYIDVLIPRGGAGLIRSVVQNATVPVIQTGTGNCHVFVDETADLEMAVNIVINAKTQRPSVCNAMETLLVHEAVADKFLNAVCTKLKEKNVELRGCEKSKGYFADMNDATEADWKTEYDDLILAVKVVSGVEEAIEHINTYGTRHSEAIVTKNFDNATKFQNEIDASCVYVNASTRFTDGFEFGFGAEIGISNQKLHARGPMGLTELTTFKYLISGNGQCRG